MTWFNPNEGTFVVEFDADKPIAPLAQFVVSSGGNARFIYIISDGQVASYNGVSSIGMGTIVTGQRNVAAVSFNSSAISGSLNGSAPAFTTVISNANLLSVSLIKIFENTNTGGTIKRLQYYPRAFDAATLQRLSRIQ